MPRRAGVGAAGLLALVVVGWGCAPGPSPRLPAAGAAATDAWALPAAEAPSQRLYRLRYDGPRGDGTLRLVLRLANGERFQLDSSDPLGRRVWSLRVDGEGALMLDHRQRTFCAAPSDIRLMELGLEGLPLSAIPRVLLGRLPAAPASGWAPGARRQRFRDAEGRAWQATLEAGRPVSWALRRGGRPELWWSGSAGEGILSHREGSQFRWRETVREPLGDGPLEPLEPPDGYQAGACDEPDLPELRQDQPSPAGGGPP